MKIDLAGRVVVVTGGAAGIGRAIVRSAHACGSRVAVLDRDGGAADSLRAEFGEAVVALQADIGSEEDCVSGMAAVVELFGELDVLVNCAGMLQRPGSTRRQDLSDWRRVIDVNLQGTFVMSREAARRMVPSGKGSIVNLSSVAGLTGFRASNAYGVAKAGVAMMTKTLALDLASKGIRVNAVAPGFIETDMLQQLQDEFGDASSLLLRRTPMGRYGTAREVAAAVMFLASDLSSFITGAILSVDGGWAAFGGVGDANAT